MSKTVQDVKLAIHSIMDKFSGNRDEYFTQDEIDTLIFAFESNVLFDNVAQKFLPSLKSILKVPDLSLTGEETEEELTSKHNEHNRLLNERNDMVQVVLLTVFKDSILRDMRIRFGV